MEKEMKENIALIMLGVIFVLPVFSQQHSLPPIETVSENIQDRLDRILEESSPDVIIGIGIGGMNTDEASMEQAKFNAHAAICGEVFTYLQFVSDSFDDVPKDVLDRLNFYQNKYYQMVSEEASGQACFMLYGLTTVEWRAKTGDGKIYYVVSLNKNEEIFDPIVEYTTNYFNSVVEDFNVEDLEYTANYFNSLVEDFDVEALE
jgi:hypothetical protein